MGLIHWERMAETTVAGMEREVSWGVGSEEVGGGMGTGAILQWNLSFWENTVRCLLSPAHSLIVSEGRLEVRTLAARWPQNLVHLREL